MVKAIGTLGREHSVPRVHVVYKGLRAGCRRAVMRCNQNIDLWWERSTSD